MPLNTRAKGQEYVVMTLALLARTGYASTRQIAKAVWHRCDDSTRKMASRTIRRLIAEGAVVERRDADSVNGERLVALTVAGANRLAQFHPLPAGKAHARDWLRHAHDHRTMCNSVYAAMVAVTLDLDIGWTELQIRSGVPPREVSEFHFRAEDGGLARKIPDVLFNLDTRPTWVEVENTWRSAKDLRKLVEFLRSIFSAPEPLVASVWFVITAPGAQTIGKRLWAAMSHAPDSGYAHAVRELDARILRNHVRVYRLDHDTLALDPVDIEEEASRS